MKKTLEVVPGSISWDPSYEHEKAVPPLLKPPKKQPLVPVAERDLPPRLLISYEYPDRTTRRCTYVNGPRLQQLLSEDTEVGRFLRRLIFNTKETIERLPDAPDDVWDHP